MIIERGTPVRAVMVIAEFVCPRVVRSWVSISHVSQSENRTSNAPLLDGDDVVVLSGGAEGG